MKSSIPYYAKNIQTLVETVENVGEKMNPYFQKIREGIDQETYSNFSKEELKEVHDVFEKGVQSYQDLVPLLASVRPPARVLGMHKRLETVYKKYITSCQEMTNAIGDVVDVEAFNTSEKEQDLLTEDLTFCIQRISTLLTGR